MLELLDGATVVNMCDPQELFGPEETLRTFQSTPVALEKARRAEVFADFFRLAACST